MLLTDPESVSAYSTMKNYKHKLITDVSHEAKLKEQIRLDSTICKVLDEIDMRARVCRTRRETF